MLKYITVTVPYYIPIAVLGLLVGVVLTSKTVPYVQIIYAAISFAFLVGGFNTLNGVFDKDIDEINKPKRPIAIGKISMSGGILYSIFLYALSIILAFFVNTVFLGIAIISIALTSFYSIPIIRLRSKFIINTMTGLVFYGILCPLAGWSLYSSQPVPIYMIIFLFLLGSGIGITKDFEDVRGDSVFRIKTAPTVFGTRGASYITGFLIAVSFVYLAAISLLRIIDVRYLAVLIFIPWVVYILHSLEPSRFENGYGVNNNKNFFVKNVFLAISVELLIIAVTLI